jgi:hypothetical protein
MKMNPKRMMYGIGQNPISDTEKRTITFIKGQKGKSDNGSDELTPD